MDTFTTPDFQLQIQNRLRDWVNQQPGSITFEEAAEFLAMPQDSDGTYYGRSTIEAALEMLGCEKEVLVHYWPPAARLARPQPTHQQPTDKAKLQEIINIIRAWVLGQTEPFQISDIYSRPHLSEQLPCNTETLQLIHQALIALRCTVNLADTTYNVYNPPPPVNTRHVSMDEIYT
ncbi:MAG: hypothetical protein IPI17_12620 [Nitrosomonas sp.]|nr:hypothetical protein [Nitrosomonas sp.]